MNAAEIAAWVGAGAWLPQMATWAYTAFVKPIVTVIPDRRAEVGFTSLGPIFNLRLAFSAERHGAIIDGLELSVQHEHGECRNLRWEGLAETFSEIRDEAGVMRQRVGRDMAPLAMKLGTTSLIELFVRFQEPRYHERMRSLFDTLLAEFNHWKATDSDFVSKTLKSRELADVIEARKQAFWWKAGRYDVEARVSSPKVIRILRNHWSFSLTGPDVERLRRNIDNLEADLRDTVQTNLPEFKQVPLTWNWANVEVTPVVNRASKEGGLRRARA
jgi:hypothetical protein